MTRIFILVAAVVATVSLAACGEREQTLGPVKGDATAYSGSSADGGNTAGTAFTAPGWKPGDKASWEQQMRTRTQNTQNEYNKVK
jgi:hypothetical protein